MNFSESEKQIPPDPPPRRKSGPKTPEGKARSCMNGWKHGMRSQFADYETDREYRAKLRDRREKERLSKIRALLLDWLNQQAAT